MITTHNLSRAQRNNDPPPSKTPLKTELQVIRMAEESQKMVMETLRYIHGEDFQLGDITKYKDLGNKQKNKYWQERGNLVIQGVCDYSALAKTGSSTEDRFRMFAIMKLETYGFHKPHCIEALDHCKGDVDTSLELLYSKYFPPPPSREKTEPDVIEHDENECCELREDEKLALESIYDQLFEEKIRNQIWQLRFKIDHLLIFSPSEMKKRETARKEEARHSSAPKVKKVKEMCRNFMKTGGKCKYGDKCRFSHVSEVDKTKDGGPRIEKTGDPNLDPNWFYLEIRFPKGNRYPYEPPIVCLKTTCPDIPHDICLRLTKRLLDEASDLAKDGMPSIYTLSEFLQMDEEISEFLKKNHDKFLNAGRSIFWEPRSADGIAVDETGKKLPSHYQKGKTGHSDRTGVSLEEKLRQDRNLVELFMKKQSNPGYKNMLKVRRELPAWTMMSNVLDVIARSQVTVISGETGCGKSTQVPQFILDDWLLQSSTLDSNRDMKHIEIVCTQPRRLSAIGVAERVADERNERVGNTIGYQIRLENKISSSTRLTFCTTGILLRRLASDPLLAAVSHIIVDEVHERSEESDFLLLILKELMMKRPELKVILMSATLNSRLFSDYFGGIPVIEIPGRTFPVEQLFLEDILERSDFVLEPDSHYCRRLKKGEEQALMDELEYCDVQAAKQLPAVTIRDENLMMADVYARYGNYSKKTCKSLFLMDPLKINPELIESILTFITEGDHKWPREGSILIFLPGLAEIQTIFDALSDSSRFSPRAGHFILVPLHSTLTNEEQALVFKKAPQGKRKIVLSTNIAETSITIDDCVFVIDCGQMKEKRFDSNRNMESLELVWVSRANAQQRKGRAGRVMPGVAIHLFTHHRYKYHILSQPVPEIHRVPLEQLLLRIKTLPNFSARQIIEVIGAILEPPTDDNINSAIIRLQDVGAFDLDQNLTALGHHLAELPVDVRIGKLMLFGAIFQCVDSVLTVAACLSYKNPFVAPFNKKAEADAKKKQFAICNSDHLTVLRAYRRWQEASRRSKYAGKCFADENFLSWKTLETLVEIKQQFLELLVSIGFVPLDLSGRSRKRYAIEDKILELTGVELNTNGENNRLLGAILCAALYPNVVKVLTPEKSFTMSASGAVPRQPLPSELRFKTRDDGYVFIHPSSVNSICGHFSSPFLVFQEKVKTSRIYIRDCTMVPLLPLILFSGSDFKIELHGGDFLIMLEGGWVMLQAQSHDVAEMLMWIRKELAKLLEEKIRDPLLNLLHHENGKKIISTIVYLLTRE